MADDTQLNIRVTADISGLSAASSQATQAVNAISTSARTSSPAFADMAESINATSASLSALSAQATSATSPIRSAISPLQSFRPNISAFNSASGALKDVSVASSEAAHASAGFYRELLVLGHELSMGNYKRFAGSLLVLAERSGRLSQIFGAVRSAATPMNLAFAATAAAIGAIVLGAYRAETALAQIRVAFASVGNASIFDPSLVSTMSSGLEKAGASAKDAQAMMLELGRTTNLTSDEFKEIAPDASNLVAKFGGAEEAGKALAEIFDDTSGAIRKYHDELASSNPEALASIQAMEAAGNKAGAAKALFEALKDSAKDLTEQGVTPLGRAWNALQNALGIYKFRNPIASLEELGGALVSAANSTLILVSAMAKLRPGTVGMSQALRQANVEASGQTYNMDKASAYIQGIKEQNDAIAAGNDQLVKDDNSTTAKLLQNIQTLEAARQAAQTKGTSASGNGDAKTAQEDLALEQQFDAQIVVEKQKLADELKSIQDKAGRDQIQQLETNLTDNLQRLGLFGDQAKAYEEKYWRDKQAAATVGTAERKAIDQKVYELDNEANQKSVDAFKEAERKKTEAAQKALEDQARIDQSDDATGKALYEIRKKTIDDEAALGEISHAQQVQALTNELNAEYALELDALNKELALLPQGTAKYVEAYNQRKVLIAQNLEDIKNLQVQALNQDSKSLKTSENDWKSYANTIGSTMKSAFSSLLQGTLNWKTEMSKLLGDLAGTVFDKQVDAMVAKWFTGQDQQTGATIAGNAARQAANTSAAAAGAATQATIGEATIQQDAAKAAAGAYSAVAAIPYVGPVLAPAAAGVAYTAVMAYENMASFDVGSWNLPSDMVAQVHQGEMIIPRTFADDLRSNGGIGSGGGDHFHVHAIDTKGMSRFIMKNSDAVAAAARMASRNGNRNIIG